jgi:hypothetical protein
MVWSTGGREDAVLTAYALGALLLAGEAVVHVEQYASIFHGVRWIGALFLVDAVVAVAAIAGLVIGRTARLAALAGIALSVGALGGLVVSYGQGLFGWQEAGFRTPVELAVIAEVGAVLFLSAALLIDRAPSGPISEPGVDPASAELKAGGRPRRRRRSFPGAASGF